MQPDGRLRPAVEDLIGAGAIIAALPGRATPEAEAARAAFAAATPSLAEALRACSSGRELAEIGFLQDVDCAAVLDASTTAAALLADDRCYADLVPALPATLARRRVQRYVADG